MTPAGRAMVGIVIVSHSARLAEGVAELAREMGGTEVPIAPAGGLDEPGALGTDAVRVMDAIEEVGGGGALVLMDLGSAVLSAETALDLLPEEDRGRVLLCEAPLVEGAVAAAAASRAGGSLEEVATEARNGLAGKRAHLGGGPAPDAPAAGGALEGGPWSALEVVVGGAHGLHARPAAAVVRAVADMDAEVRLSNLTGGSGPVSGRSLTALSTLGAREGERLRIEARGPGAAEALATVAALVAGGEASPPATEPAAVAPPAPGETLEGVPAAPGRGMGAAHVLRDASPQAPREAAGPPEAEREALRAARARAHGDLQAIAAAADPQTREILEAQLLLLDDAALVDAAEAAVAGGASAAWAWDDAARGVAATYAGLEDPYLRERGGDVLEVGRRVVALLGAPGPTVAPEGIVVAAELGAAEVAAIDPARVTGIATAGGGPTSHASIIARALGIPAVVGLGPRVTAIADGASLLIDGDTGRLVVEPDAEAVIRHAQRVRADETLAERARARAHEPALTSDGHTVEVAGNIGAAGEAAAVVEAGGDGVGLLRTEFLFLGRRTAPSEDEQHAAYAEALAALEGRRLVLRTLDAGADKPLPYLALPAEDNPFLGVRGLRLCLARPEILRTQLRAALRAASEGPMGVMFPMVSEIGELRAARALLEEARASLEADGLPAGPVEVGSMVEVPAAALLADALAAEVDFLSIGTNDLVQYTMAAERGNGGVAHLSDPAHPAVLRLVGAVVEAAGAHGCRVAVCGEAAADPVLVPLLVGLGVDELSVAAPRIALVKQRVRELSREDCRALADDALALSDASAVRRRVAADH